ncbi:hypothetical protein G3485_17355 [Shewanella baltica]|uniref:hypothetical protein n=1 Tax=Shewanella baltica TaxID=62322 RepID=UPI00217DDCE8|nr:hypothetical protein [Shewanella baltica]MCS6128887.1 hypothetical protein [Shewanella baltica]MCS6140817.1 hypothetical protein [Shewanella baltica]MCS6147101.1 hypothetical protein [Shewanella baltica]MCS6171630.1 hypothetical protein [Shewanella baltica]MCS6188855.1 hypothetical protein [Shewanella baltica]
MTHPDQLPEDDLTNVEPEHFSEFDAALAAAQQIEGGETPSDALGYQAVEAAHVSGAELIAPIIGLACMAFAPNWNIAPEEQQALAESYGALIDKYFPEGAGAFGVELNALIITGAILAPRFKTPRHAEKEVKNDDQTTEKAG